MSAIQDLINQALNILNSSEVKQYIRDTVKQWYDKGLSREESKYPINFTRNDKKLNLLQENTEDLIKDVTDDLRDKVSYIVKETQINNGSIKDIRKKLKDLFKGKDLAISDSTGKKRVINWKTRVKTIARTESNRTANMGHLDGMKQLPVKMRKYLSITFDARTSKVSKKADEKYGSIEKSIPLEKNFKFSVKVGNKTLDIDKPAPPFIPNDRDRVMFVSQRKYEEVIGKKIDKQD